MKKQGGIMKFEDDDDDDKFLTTLLGKLPVNSKPKPRSEKTLRQSVAQPSPPAIAAHKRSKLVSLHLPFPRAARNKMAGRKVALSSIEMCAGAGGQAIGLEEAGFGHQALIEIDPDCCATLRMNRPDWNVLQSDLREASGKQFKGADLLAGGLPCPPFSIAGKQLGDRDERNLFPAAFRLIEEIRPRAVMIENVKGFLSPAFRSYREGLRETFRKLGYHADWRLLNAADFGVPQLRPRVVIVALTTALADRFDWPLPLQQDPPVVGDVLCDLMAARGWREARDWSKRARAVAPTIVGGSKKHGGPDLGPTRARRAWAELHVDGLGIANEAPEANFKGMPRLTVRMVARLQGFPDTWSFSGKKTASYRQVGNAFPPPVAQAVAEQIAVALSSVRSAKVA